MSPFEKARNAQVGPLPGHDGLLLARPVVLAEETQRETPGQPFRLPVRHVQNCFQFEQISHAGGFHSNGPKSLKALRKSAITA